MGLVGGGEVGAGLAEEGGGLDGGGVWGGVWRGGWGVQKKGSRRSKIQKNITRELQNFLKSYAQASGQKAPLCRQVLKLNGKDP